MQASDFITPPFSEELFAKLLSLNNAHATELSFKTEEGFRRLLAAASFVRAEPDGLALLVGFNETCDYDSPNFLWLQQHYPRFNYVDRVVVSEAARGRGLARRLYDAFESVTRAEDRERLVCEINSVPPNPASDSFHEALGFVVVGEQRFQDSGKTVRYWAKELG